MELHVRSATHRRRVQAPHRRAHLGQLRIHAFVPLRVRGLIAVDQRAAQLHHAHDLRDLGVGGRRLARAVHDAAGDEIETRFDRGGSG
jgi:hypothetical protein